MEEYPTMRSAKNNQIVTTGGWVRKGGELVWKTQLQLGMMEKP